MTKTKILIGIDTGVQTGYSKSVDGKLIVVTSMGIVEAMERVRLLKHHQTPQQSIKLYIEDARLRTWIPPTKQHEVLQGVGSVKRDAQVWEEFCLYHDIDFQLVAPKDNNTKLSAKDFKRITGWQKRTNEHARDSAMLIFGK